LVGPPATGQLQIRFTDHLPPAVASLDPLGRREFLQTLTEATAVEELTVLLFSRIIVDSERVCNYLIIYRLVPPKELSVADLQAYRMRLTE
jgi:hypothetical protein